VQAALLVFMITTYERSILMKTSRVIPALIAASSLFLAALSGAVSTSASAKPTSVAAKKPVYKLLWSQEFNGSKRVYPSDKVWNYDTGNNGGWGNNENEYYTMTNARTDGRGSMVIKATKIPPGDITASSCVNCSYFSSRITTQGKLGFKYGRMQARVQMPKGDGTWPAFWLLGSNITNVPWPTCGEIDMFEVGTDPNTPISTIHGPVSGFMGITNGGYYNSAPLSNTYHTYTMDWTPNKFSFYFDNNTHPYFSITRAEAESSTYNNEKWVFNHEFFLILNLAMGGNFVGGAPDPAINTASLKFDYIRYYSINGVGTLYRH